jgi:hypothetical protein
MRLPEGLRRVAYRLAGREPTIEDERLYALFRNRVELKKELNEIDDERHRLQDRLKLQEGATMRVEEQMAALEQYLGRADEGYKCLAYYQLRGLWRTASRRLEQFGSELQRQQKDRERKQQLADFDRDKRSRTVGLSASWSRDGCWPSSCRPSRSWRGSGSPPSTASGTTSAAAAWPSRSARASCASPMPCSR